jgi:glycosyltransferase involved in cell wall biosynthesis
VRSANALISIGRFTEEGFRALTPEPPPITTIPNGIDLEAFLQAARRPPHLDPMIRAGRYFLFLGRLKKRKGVDILLQALALFSGGGIQLVIAGTGEEESAIDAQIDCLGLRDRVRRVGRVDGPDKVYLLQNALCTVMPSRVWEAFPMVLLESCAAGRPVLGTAVPGIVDLVRDGETGLVVPEESPQALAAAMNRMLSNPESAEMMGINARRFAQDYSWNAVARRHIALYEQL